MPIPILTYHSIEKGALTKEALSPDDTVYKIRHDLFEAQMKYLADHQIQTLLIDDLVSTQKQKRPGPSRIVVCLTFDDGNGSDYTVVYPILKRFGLKATFFVVTNQIGTPGHVTWEQLREMSGSGMSIQSHSHTHPFLSQCTDAQVKEEFATSKAILEERLSRMVRVFAVPGGDTDKRLRSIGKTCGYEAVCTSRPGINQPPLDLYALERLSIRRSDSLDKFIRLIMLNPRVLFAHTLYDRVLIFARGMLGLDKYRSLRTWILRHRKP